jgi:transcriptional regulator with XRE-family HTH domain
MQLEDGEVSPERPISLKTAIEQAGFEGIGQRIRRRRTDLGLSLNEVSELAEVSKNTLIRVEKGQSIQLASLKSIARALQFKIRDLLEDQSESSVIAVHRRPDDVWFDMNGFINLATSSPLPNQDHPETEPGVIPFCILLSRFQSGKFNPNLVIVTEPTKPRAHLGEEFVFVLEGELGVCFGRNRIDLKCQESALFFASERHWYEPIGETPTRILSIVFDPFPTEWPL